MIKLPVVAAVLLCAAVASAQQPPAYPPERLDQLSAPVALYPDELLSQIFMASTYPEDVAAAAKWSKEHPGVSGDAALKQVEAQPWDPSVKALVAFPDVIQPMGQNPDWVQDMGDAFLAQPEQVLDSVQRLRREAKKAGNLETNDKQKVVVEQPAPEQPQVIEIQPASPETVYVPQYNPATAYGTWAYPSYPPVGWPVGAGLATGIGWGIGVAATGALWSDVDWGGGDIDINVNDYNRANVNQRMDVRQNNVGWQHNSGQRGGTPYRDTATRQRYDQRVPGAQGREAYRGRTGTGDQRAVQRQRAQTTMQDRGARPTQQRGARPAQPQRGARPAQPQRARPTQPVAGRERPAARAPAQRQHAMQGVGQGRQTQMQSARGASSQRSMAQHRGGGRPAGRPSGGGGRGGGGRRR